MSAASGLRAGRGSQPGQRDAGRHCRPGCARPPRLRGSQRPCGPGEGGRSEAAAGHRAGRGSQGAGGDRSSNALRLRPANMPGEVRNVKMMVGSSVKARAAPGHRTGRGSQLAEADLHHQCGRVLRPASAPGEDRNSKGTPDNPETLALRPAIAPGEDRNHAHSGWYFRRGHGCARPSRRARIARTATTQTAQAKRQTASGHCAGRGSQREDDRRVQGERHQLRPATVPGEDRNAFWRVGADALVSGCAQPLRRGGSQPRHGRRLGYLHAARCARPSRRARIATSSRTCCRRTR
jgi:hypothetical protein